jgi:hypothetical protein
MSEDSVSALQALIASTPLYSHRLGAALHFVAMNPQFAGEVGLLSLGPNQFGANSAIFGKFIGRRPNTVRLAFRTHGVRQMGQLDRRIRQELPDPRNWKLHFCEGANSEADPAVIFRFQSCSRKPRKGNGRKSGEPIAEASMFAETNEDGGDFMDDDTPADELN